MDNTTIAGDIRRIRSLLKLEESGAVIRKEDYGTFLKLLDAIETKAKRITEDLNE